VTSPPWTRITTWTTDTRRPDSSPAIAWSGSNVLIAAADGNGNLDYWWQPSDTTSWDPEQIASA
jgi:hypothetical protein